MVTLRWFEPSAFKRAQIWESGVHRGWLLVGLVVTAVVLGVGAVVPQGPIALGWGWLALVGSGAGLFVYLLQWATTLVPHEVRISETGIRRTGWEGGLRGVQSWAWDKVAYGRVGSTEAAGRSFRVAEFCTADDHVIGTVALPARVDDAALRSAFAAHGKDVREGLPAVE